mgnify:CR=1 FL=1
MGDEEPPPIAAMLSKNLQLFIVVRRPTCACACSTELRMRPASVPVTHAWVRFSPPASWSGIPAPACCPAPWARQAAGTPSLARALGQRSQLPCGMNLGRYGMEDVPRPLFQSGLPQGLPRSRSLEESGWHRRDGRSSCKAMTTGGELATRVLVSGWVGPIMCAVANLPALWSCSNAMRDVGWPCGTARALGGPADDG